MTALKALFSTAVAAVDTREPDLDESLLWPAEDAQLGQVVAGRRWDWVMGRRCARLAIEGLGMDPAPVLAGSKRQPLWPEGLVGAITHTAGYAAAAVARGREVRSLGLDAEPDQPLPRGILPRIALEAEQDWIAGGPQAGVDSPDRLLFCVKEAVYKTWFPLTQRWLGFTDALVSVDAAAHAFTVEILVDGPVQRLTGRYASDRGIILAAIELPH